MEECYVRFCKWKDSTCEYANLKYQHRKFNLLLFVNMFELRLHLVFNAWSRSNLNQRI